MDIGPTGETEKLNKPLAVDEKVTFFIRIFTDILILFGR